MKCSLGSFSDIVTTELASEETGQGNFEDIFAQTLSVNEAAEISGFTTGWIRQLLIKGELKGFKIGRDWRVPKNVLQDYMDKERRPGPKTD